jgi:inorganic pyrophosphatase
MLNMEDEKGPDEKIVCVPHDKIHTQFTDIKTVNDLPEITRQSIQHFFTTYKDLEKGKWVKVTGWVGPEEAEAAITKSIAAAKK